MSKFKVLPALLVLTATQYCFSEASAIDVQNLDEGGKTTNATCYGCKWAVDFAASLMTLGETETILQEQILDVWRFAEGIEFIPRLYIKERWNDLTQYIQAHFNPDSLCAQMEYCESPEATEESDEENVLMLSWGNAMIKEKTREFLSSVIEDEQFMKANTNQDKCAASSSAFSRTFIYTPNQLLKVDRNEWEKIMVQYCEKM